jgi:uncharacterized protein
MDVIEAARAFAESRHEGAGPSHDLGHVERVRRLALAIGEAEGADLLVIELAALLHDIGRVRVDSRGEEADRHEEVSAELAGPFLAGQGLPEAARQAVLEAILCHRHRRGRKAGSLEARCLFDADKLDSLGAVGVARAYLWLGEHGRSVWYPPESWAGVEPGNNSTEVDSFQREWEIKFRGLRDRMYTAEGRRIAALRHERMATILSWIEEEASLDHGEVR